MTGIGLVTSVKGLQQEMYRQQKGSGGAYMLLNATGRIGSQGEHMLPHMSTPVRGQVYTGISNRAAGCPQVTCECCYAAHQQISGVLVSGMASCSAA